MADKIIIKQTIHKDGQYPTCVGCLEPAVELQIECNCGCDGTWCQPCYYKHYRDVACEITLKRFINRENDMGVIGPLIKSLNK
jgi:hypothetical protein